ncbi:hypothetical protein [Scytonema sp. NUACC26]|uniref:hypothetical protein n=1 Tax=Scytonema sp. NUACC26 TaxID=3140176 RepID=UPI0034DC5C70
MTIEVFNHKPPYIVNENLLTIVETYEDDDFTPLETIDLSKIDFVDWRYNCIIVNGCKLPVEAQIIKALNHWYFIQNNTSTKKINNRQITTILAALRFFQSRYSFNKDSFLDDHFEYYSPLSNQEIDELCESLNFD